MAQSVLVVEDEPNIVLSLEFIMKQAGFEVRIAGDGEAALDAMKEQRPDLILLDVMLPKFNGYEVCQTIRANPDWSDVAIIMLSAKGRDAERLQGLAAGADDYVIKPFSNRDLLDRVKRHMGNGGAGAARPGRKT